MENLNRYRPASEDGRNFESYGPSYMEPDDGGEWVKFSDVAEALKPSHNSQSTPLCACGQPAVKVLCDNCFCDEVFAATKKRA